jgi:hypothetical protein
MRENHPDMAQTMAPTTHSGPAPVTEEAFLADRMAFWSFFTNATTIAAATIAVILILLTIFLV